MKKVETLRQLQLVSLYVFKDLKKFCDKNGLTLYLLGGTLIGAVRHKGFIPWDDDIDVCMSRDDYKRLVKLSDGKISEKCSLIDPATARDYKGYIPVVVYNNSELTSGQFREKEHLKIGVSIFVYDGVPTGAFARKLYFTRMYFLRAEHALCRADFKKVNSRIAKIVGPFLSTFYRRENVYKYKLKIIQFSQKYAFKKSTYVAPNTDTNAWLEVFSRKEFERSDELDFEGIRCKVFGYYHKHLSNYYGDYMKLPSAEAQISKHDFDATVEDSFTFD